MEIAVIFLDVELKAHYFNDFVTCGLPVPQYINDTTFKLRFRDHQNYLNYRALLNRILDELVSNDPNGFNYDIQRSVALIRHILLKMNEQFSKRHN